MQPSSPNIRPDPETLESSTAPAVTPLTPLEANTKPADAKVLNQKRSPFVILRRARRGGLIAGLVVVVVIGIIVTIYVTKRPKNSRVSLSDGNLSDAQLQKLSSDSIGSTGSTQALTFHSPTTFDDTLKVSGKTTLKDLTISGVFNPSALDVAKNFQVGGITLLQGDVSTKGQLSVGSNLNVTGTSVFGGNVTFNSGGAFAGSLSANSLNVKTASIGGLSFGHIITTGSNPTGSMAIASGGGNVVISGNDTSGTIIFTLGSSPTVGDMVTLNFRSAFSSTPHINLTPVGMGSAGARYYVTRSVNSFTIGITNPTPGAQYIFDYLVTQ